MRAKYVKKPKDEEKMQASLRAVEKKQLPHMLCVTNMLLHGGEDPSFVRHDNTLARPYISYKKADRVDIVVTNPPFGGREEDGIESNFPAHFRTRETADLFLDLIIRLLKPSGRAAVVLPDGSLFGEGVKSDPVPPTLLHFHFDDLVAVYLEKTVFRHLDPKEVIERRRVAAFGIEETNVSYLADRRFGAIDDLFAHRRPVFSEGMWHGGTQIVVTKCGDAPDAFHLSHSSSRRNRTTLE